ncbi:hypothetical protein WR25_06132 [Diploscapter pachys]|uniref:Uncharacterized protein n=1 Tax=Diploscapter pachys TaxID=2018661 RepID=A0A2A2LDS8_9BILA|nr:hypothetical protein WR25_06132 [Diploscapter pachys]
MQPHLSAGPPAMTLAIFTFPSSTRIVAPSCSSLSVFTIRTIFRARPSSSSTSYGTEGNCCSNRPADMFSTASRRPWKMGLKTF